jgi:dTDP-glucose 4,6-dehydratase
MNQDFRKLKLLITGGAGFIGHHLVEGVLKETDWDIVILDRLDISGNLERLRDIEIWEKEKYRVKFIWWDLKSPVNDNIKKEIGPVDYIWHLAASSHVDRSIEDPLSFVMDNVVGTCNILNFARQVNSLKLFINFNTDECFGPAPEGVFYKESDRHNPKNPYAASKTGQWALGVAFENCYKTPIINTYTMNVLGERQHPEKFIPLVARKVLNGEKVLIHGNKDRTQAGKRHYIHARNVCKALLFLTIRGFKEYEEVNIVGEKEIDNLTLAQFIAKVIGKELNYEIVDFHSSRPGHDLRYALDGTKLKNMGFVYPKTFEDSLEKAIRWIIDPINKKWLDL